jgi:hypothetical protein
MKKILFGLKVLTAWIICANITVSAQIQQAWVVKYNNGITNGNHQALKVALDANGNIYVLGVSANNNTNTGYAVVKYAPNGNQVWAVRYDSTNFPTATPSGFVLDSGGNIAVTGNAVTLKYDRNGNVLWIAPYDGTAIAVDLGRNTYITGVSNTFTTIKLDSAGSNLWTTTGGANLAQVIAVDASSNAYVAGKVSYYVPPFNETDIALVKYNANGSQIWDNTLRTGSRNFDADVVAIQLDTLGNIYVEANFGGPTFSPYSTFRFNSAGSGGPLAGNPTAYGSSFSAALDLDSKGNIIVTGHNGYPSSYGTYKIDTNGNYVWANLYPMSSNGGGAALAEVVDSGNNIYITGESTLTNTPYDIATLKLAPNGNQLWVQRYKGPGFGNAGNAIVVDNSGNVYVAGYETETNGFTSMILIKYSPVTGQKQSNGNFILHAYGSPGESFDLQASTNLQT